MPYYIHVHFTAMVYNDTAIMKKSSVQVFPYLTLSWHTLILFRIYVIENKMDFVSFDHTNRQREVNSGAPNENIVQNHLRAVVSRYGPEVYKSEKSKILKKIHKVALGT